MKDVSNELETKPRYATHHSDGFASQGLCRGDWDHDMGGDAMDRWREKGLEVYPPR